MWEDKERRKKATEHHFKTKPMALMKHFDGSRGMAGFNEGKYKLVKDDTEVLIIFNTIDELSDAGWSITT